MGVRVRSAQELIQIQTGNLIPEGTYNFRVKAASDEQSKSGNDMVKLLLEIKTANGIRNTFDYLVDVNSMAFKIKNFCETTGIQAEFINADECIGLRGRVEIVIKPSENGYPPKNAVADYVSDTAKVQTSHQDVYASLATPAPTFSQAVEVQDDDIPF